MTERREIESKIVSLLGKLVAATERSADANEALIRMADEENRVELETPPPFCPHCMTVNPEVIIEVDGQGMLEGFVMAAQCLKCENRIFAIAAGWVCVKEPLEVEAFMEGGNNGHA